jgi:peptidoglycan hydrolase-like protein with peptidoglycan-binding domain
MAKIAVFAGHGGRDNGAQSNERLEKDYTLAVMTNVTQILRNRGYEVINNRTEDVDRSIREDAILANESGVDGVVEIHLNSNEGIPQNGTETYYSIFDDGLGKKLAQNIQNAIVALGFADRGIKTRAGVSGRDFFGIIRLTNAPAVLVETAFINNENDMAMYDISTMSAAIADGITETFPISSGGVGGDPTIRRIQSFLNNNYGANLKVDGIFGPLTKSAMIKAWQTELNNQFDRELEVDGIFGAKTKLATVSIGKGARGNLTYLLQGILYARGYSLSLDSIYGIRTENAVKSYQNDRGLYPSGVANPDTQYSLFN